MNIFNLASVYRSILRGAAIAGLASLCVGPADAQGLPTITMAISQTPWLKSFVAEVDAYERATGNKMKLDVLPFGGLLEKARNSVRGSQAAYDIVSLNAIWLTEFYSGGFLAPLTDCSIRLQIARRRSDIRKYDELGFGSAILCEEWRFDGHADQRQCPSPIL